MGDYDDHLFYHDDPDDANYYGDAEDYSREYHAIVNQTEKAVLVKFGASFGSEPVWFPKSVCSFDESTKILYVRSWFVEKEGLWDLFE